MSDVYDKLMDEERDQNILSSQVWQLYDSVTQLTGLQLAKRQYERGMFPTLQTAQSAIVSKLVGECLKTGVSVWQRIK